MGLFLFVSAIKNKSPEDIAAKISKYTKRRNIIADVKPFTEWMQADESSKIDIHNIISQPISMASIYQPINRWSVVIYNNCLYDEKEISKFLSLELQSLVSLIEVFDSELWYHFLFYNGNQVDQFSSYPEEYEKGEKIQFFKGNLRKIAFYFDVDESYISPYLIHIPPEMRSEYIFKKAYEDDTYALADEWIFIDFWRHLGIKYPTELPIMVILHEDE
jgi:hypothetical protein